MYVYCIQEEDEVPDDETVNQMIARSEEEFELFMVSVLFLDEKLFSSQRKTSASLCFRSVWTWTDAARRPVTHGESHA